jgi:RHS repeat-associated protein
MIGGYSTVSWDNVVATTNSTPGTVMSYDDFDAWGMVLEGRSGNTADGRQRFKFTGKERDVESNYDYFGARSYDSKIARFIQFDPHGSRYANLSAYCYVGNNPLGFVDPSGKDLAWAAMEEESKENEQHERERLADEKKRQAKEKVESRVDMTEQGTDQSNQIQKSHDGAVLGIATVDALWKEAKAYAGTTELGKGFEVSESIVGRLGKLTGITSAGFAITDAINDPTLGNVSVAIGKSALVVAKETPATAVVAWGVAISDATGLTPYVSKQITDACEAARDWCNRLPSSIQALYVPGQ